MHEWWLDGDDVDDLAATLRTKFNGTLGKSEQRVIAATSDVDAGVEVRSALTNQDFAGFDLLAAIALYAQALSVRVTTVASRTRSLFVCQFALLPRGLT